MLCCYVWRRFIMFFNLKAEVIYLWRTNLDSSLWWRMKTEEIVGLLILWGAFSCRLAVPQWSTALSDLHPAMGVVPTGLTCPNSWVEGVTEKVLRSQLLDLKQAEHLRETLDSTWSLKSQHQGVVKVLCPLTPQQKTSQLFYFPLKFAVRL